MDKLNFVVCKDGGSTRPATYTPSSVELPNQKLDGTLKKKRRRGKSKRKIIKPFMKIPWQDRRKNDKSKRNNRFRKIVLAKTHAPFNNNQFLMEIHKPEPENNFHILRTPSARTRDSSFSIDSEDNYFYSLPEDEEEYLTKEFSSVYEDAQSERLSNMSKDDLVQEYLLLEAKYENLVKRTERSRAKCLDDNKDLTVTDRDTSVTDRDSMITDKDTSGTSVGSSVIDENCFRELMQRMKEQEEQLHALKLDNEKLRLENQHLQQRSQDSSSADSESDSSSTSNSDSSSSRSASPINEPIVDNNHVAIENNVHMNGEIEETPLSESYPLVNGSHDSFE